VDNVIAELKAVKERFDFITDVHFCDDCFLLATEDYIKEFTEKYKQEIDLPFYCLTSPATITEKKLKYLVDAGLMFVSIGIQSGSPRTLKMYHRQNANKGIEEVLEWVNQYKETVFPYYDFLIENPLESDEDLLETINLIKKIRRPYKIRVYSLVPFPGTELFYQQEENHLIGSDKAVVYRKDFAQRSQEKRYLNLLIDVSRYQLPAWVLNFLSSSFMLKLSELSVSKLTIKFLYKLLSVKHNLSERKRYKKELLI